MLAGLSASKEDIKALNQIISNLDPNQCGYLSPKEIARSLDGQILIPADDLIKKMEVDSNGRINSTDFVNAAIDY